MSSSNNTASSVPNQVAGKKRVREELDEGARQETSPSPDGPPNDPAFTYVPWERPTRKADKIKKLFLESELCNFTERTESALYQDGDEQLKRRKLMLVKEADWQRLEASAAASRSPPQVAVTSVATATEDMTKASSSRQESTQEMAGRQLQKVLKELDVVDVDTSRSKLLQERAALLLDVYKTFTSGC